MPQAVEERTPWKVARKFAFPALWAIILGVLFLIREVLAPFIGAVLIAYLLAPLVGWLCRKITVKGRCFSLPRWVAVLSIYAVLLGLVAMYGAVAVPRIGTEFGKLAREGEQLFSSLTPEKIDHFTLQIKEWVEEHGLPVRIVTPHTPDELHKWHKEGARKVGEAQRAALESLCRTGGGPVAGAFSPGSLRVSAPPVPFDCLEFQVRHAEPRPERRGGFVLDSDKVIKNALGDLTRTLRTHFFDFLTLGPKFAVKLFRNVLMAFLILMVAAFLMGNPGKLIGFFRNLFPERLHGGYYEVLHEMDKGLAGVVRGQVMICLVNGVLTFIGLMILGVKFPVMLSSLAAVLSLIPIFGSILSSVPIVAVALTDGFYTGLGTLAWIIGIHLVEANLLNPKIMGESARIHPALVILALVAGEHFYGIVGALFAVPITSVGLAFFRVLHRRARSWNQEMYHDAEARAGTVADESPGGEDRV